jgi:AcrR family transcriptional regulator
MRARETVTLVVDAARRALKSAGESAVRIQEISSQTGVSIGSIYHHFGDREGLIRAAYIEQFTQSVAIDVEHLQKWTANIKSTDELREYYAHMLEFLTKHYEALPTVDRAAIVGNALARPELRAAIAQANTQLLDGLTEVLSSLAERGMLKEHIMPRAAAQIVIGMLHGRVIAELDSTNSVSVEEWNRAVLSAFGGLFRD